MGQQIGQMNGPWALLLRFALATYPMMVGWAVWVTGSVYELRGFQNRGDRFTLVDGMRMERDINAKLQQMDEKLDQYEREFSKEFVRKNELGR